jgi:hypothetical protein
MEALECCKQRLLGGSGGAQKTIPTGMQTEAAHEDSNENGDSEGNWIRGWSCHIVEKIVYILSMP